MNEEDMSLSALMSDDNASSDTGVNEAPIIETKSPVRDEQGRFAAKQEEPEAAAVEEPALAEPHDKGGVPMSRLKAEADKRREAEASAESMRRELAELRGMVMARQQPQPQQQQPEPQPVTLWDDPNRFIESQLQPVQQTVQQLREELWESRAINTHGAEKLQAAKKAAEAIAGTPQAIALHQQLMSGGNPFDNLVKWHTQNEIMSKIGNDPDAWLQAEMERRLSDPAEQAKIMERIRQGATANSNRSQPLTSIPPSLSRLPAGGNSPADNDVSDSGLFNFATR